METRTHTRAIKLEYWKIYNKEYNERSIRTESQNLQRVRKISQSILKYLKFFKLSPPHRMNEFFLMDENNYLIQFN